MKKTSYQNNKSLALEIIRGKWLIHNAPELREAARAFLERQAIEQNHTDSHGKAAAQFVTIKGESFDLGTDSDLLPQKEQMVLIVPVHGALTKYDNCFGCSTMEVVDILEAYRKDDSICGFVLDIDSPGGSVNAVMPLIAQINKIKADGKPIISHVDQCCSAAYWIASQTDAIFADNILSEVGSIGAYCEIYDCRENKQTGEKVIGVYAPESSDKNRAYREALDGNVELMQKELSDIVQTFISDVKAGRKGIKADEEGVTTGAVFGAAKAIELNMINSMADLESCVENVFVRANK